MNLETIVGIAQIVATITVVGGTVFGLIQLAEFRKQRRDAVAGELMRAFMNPEFAQAITVVLEELPERASADDVRRADPRVERAAVLINTTFETMGLLVFERIAPFPLAVELVGGIVVVMWRKLQPWAEQIRIEQSQPSWAEWFQWLAMQCERHKNPQAPAYTQHRDWVP